MTVEMRSRFREGDTLEYLSPSGTGTVTVSLLCDADGTPENDAKLVQARYSFACPVPLERGDLFRRRLF